MTKEQCIKIAKQYNTRAEWRKAHGKSFYRAKYYKWMTACTRHMAKGGRLARRKLKHTFMLARDVARKYPTRTQWFKAEPRTYQFAQINNLIDNCFRHAPKKNQPRNVMCVETGKIYPGVRAAVRATGIKGIPMVLTGKKEKSHGYSFIYLD